MSERIYNEPCPKTKINGLKQIINCKSTTIDALKRGSDGCEFIPKSHGRQIGFVLLPIVFWNCGIWSLEQYTGNCHCDWAHEHILQTCYCSSSHSNSYVASCNDLFFGLWLDAFHRSHLLDLLFKIFCTFSTHKRKSMAFLVMEQFALLPLSGIEFPVTQGLFLSN